MQHECTRCHRQFRALSEEQTVCPACLDAEFASAKPLVEAEREELSREYASGQRRQHARALKMKSDYIDDARFSLNGKLRFVLALILVLVGQFFFLLGSGENYSTALSELPLDLQRVLSVIICWTAALLVLFSSRHCRWLTVPLSLFFLVLGWFSPDLWSKESPSESPVPQSENGGMAAAGKKTEEKRGLSEQDLQVFADVKQAAPRQTHYAIFLNEQDARTRSVMRDAFTRLFEADNTRAYTRGHGLLYVVMNASPNAMKAADVAARFGRITYDGGDVVEVAFDAEKANMVSRYAPSVLASPLNSSFVAANLAEIRSVDPMRVRMAAQTLQGANVKALRHEVHDALMEVLQDPWDRELETYGSLVDALVCYSDLGDLETQKICRRYIARCETMQSNISPSALMLMIRECPQEMLHSVVNHWLQDPVVWDNYMTALGERAEPLLLERLAATKSLGDIKVILKYLRLHGTSASIPAVEKLLNFDDATVRYDAKSTLSSLRER